MKQKRFFPLRATMVPFFISLVGAVLFYSCKGTTAFKTPNDTGTSQATVTFLDGTSKEGVLTVLFENTNPEMNHIYFIPSKSKTSQTLDFRTIRSYSIAGNVYVPKLIDAYGNGEKVYLFVKRLTAEDAKLQLFELHQLFKSTDSGEENYEYFISILGAGLYDAVNITSSRFIPFERSMDDYVQGCPTLLEKIRQKEKGYYFSPASFKSKRVEVIKRIVSEYNNCR